MKIYYHNNQALHNPQTYFSRGKMRAPQEVPARVVEFQKGIKNAGKNVTEPKDFGFDPITRIHGFAYVDFLKTAYQEWHETSSDWGEEVMPNIFVKENNALKGILAKAAYYIADGSAPIGEHSWTSIYWSAQSAINAAQDIVDGKKLSMSISRPSGHHARKESAGGFCFLNNAAISAQHILDQNAAKKVLILDTDVHHGQGIQEIFYDRSDVMYISLHGDPTNFYPVVAGYDNERGEGEGLGFNINYPFEHGASEETFFKYLDKAIEDIKIFNPDVIIHNMGFDVYKEDPQTQTQVDTPSMAKIAEKVIQLGKPTLALIEGGYHVETLAANLASYMKGIEQTAQEDYHAN